jgi:hypothetical protein
MQKNSKFNFWPIGIALFFFYVLGMIIWTVVSAVTAPPQEENMYMSSYQYVDEHYNDMLDDEAWFDKKYKLSSNVKDFKIGENVINITISSRDNKVVGDIEVTSLLTRVETNKLNSNIGKLSFDGKSFSSKTFFLNKKGRWIVLFKIKVEDKIIHKKIDLTIA